MSNNFLTSIHPGEILLEEYLKPLSLSQNKLAIAMHIPVRRINEIVNQRRSITADTALRLARFFNTTPEFWLNLQMLYDVRLAQRKLGNRLERDVRTLEEIQAG